MIDVRMLGIADNLNDNSDWTNLIQKCIYEANSMDWPETVYLAAGNYNISKTIDVLMKKPPNGTGSSSIEPHEEYFVNPARSCRIEGENAGSVTISISNGWDQNEPVFRFKYISKNGDFSSTGLRNVSLIGARTDFDPNDDIPDKEGFLVNKGTAIEVNTINFGIFENIRIYGFNTGIHLFNNNGDLNLNIEQAGWTEFCQFNQIILRYNLFGIKISSKEGTDSFHGNNFSAILLDVQFNEVGIFIDKKTHFYNGKIEINAFASDWFDAETNIFHRPILIDNDGNSELLTGTITVETNKPNTLAILTGFGKFWMDGKLKVFGEDCIEFVEKPLLDNIRVVPIGFPNYSFDNFWGPGRTLVNTNFAPGGGFQTIFGQRKFKVVEPNDFDVKFQTIFEVKRLISGRLYVCQEMHINPWAASAVFDIHAGPQCPDPVKLVQSSGGWNNSIGFLEQIMVNVDVSGLKNDKPILVRLGICNKSYEFSLYYHFVGLYLP
jgi:hypothetical protein